jgi:hypothetical protein
MYFDGNTLFTKTACEEKLFIEERVELKIKFYSILTNGDYFHMHFCNGLMR